jgi:hypothetical protein
LVSFDKNIKIEISFPDRFANAVEYFRKNDILNKENLIRFVKDSELEETEKKHWINSINEMF